MTPKDVLVTWLNDAYGMENSLIQVLQHQIKDAKDIPPMQARLEQHLMETKQHAETVKGCVERFGGTTSALKTGVASITGTIQALSTGIAQDELIKNALHGFAAENFEVGCYTSLIAAAEEIGESAVATACRQILAEDQAMAQWIQQNIPMLTSAMMQKMAGATA